ncbi:hypothetical protein K431DRAFT_284484 [Polychaeton citri CBS 116435]|uniref:Uncharacterized protein n=1 Tax=Polychaeton citri CBS 116435 TaxID=1314669 RepID=A0A9P4QBD6_9PEZI|nr:hypothetical protein K431DRAFT_284484 [Polychaeton citri CBS 116435]
MAVGPDQPCSLMHYQSNTIQLRCESICNTISLSVCRLSSIYPPTVRFSSCTKMSAGDIVTRMQSIAEADAAGDAAAHIKLLEEIDNLRQAVETPVEKMMRMRFQVR